jgi:molybdopterin/thiamine biosynthesis adenylyltransferase
MSELSLIRHLSIFNPTKNNIPVHIIGAGATGSRLWLALVELGLTNISIYDFDNVEAHNLANQIYLHDDIGKPKVEALQDYYKAKTGREPMNSFKFINQEVNAENFNKEDFNGVVFILTDTMSSRKDIFENLIQGSQTFAMIETRMSSSFGDVKTVNPFDETQSQEWLDSLISDDDAEVSACGSSISVGPTASIIANLAVWQFIHTLTNPEALDANINLHLKPLMLSL